jgi:hypothetical protein
MDPRQPDPQEPDEEVEDLDLPEGEAEKLTADSHLSGSTSPSATLAAAQSAANSPLKGAGGL